MDFLERVRQLTLGNLEIYRQRAELRAAGAEALERRERLAAHPPVRESYIRAEEVRPYEELKAARREAIRSVDEQIRGQRTVARFPTVDGQSLAHHGFRSNPAVFGAIRLYVNQLRLSVPRVVDADGVEVGENHRRAQKVRKIFTNPSGMNGSVLWSDLLDEFPTDLLSFGNHFLEIGDDTDTDTEGQLLWRLEPWNVRIVPLVHPWGWVHSYIYDMPVELGGERLRYRIPVERMIHLRVNDPTDPFFGIPPLHPCRKPIAIDNELADLFQVTLQNRAVLPYALVANAKEMLDANVPFRPDDPLAAPGAGPPSALEIRDKFHEDTTGPHRGKPGVIMGMEIKTMALNMEEMGIGHLVSYPESRIWQALGVPPSLVGTSGDQDQPNRSNMHQEVRAWLEGPVTSMVKMYEQGFNGRVIPIHDKTPQPIRAILDISEIAALQAAKLDRLVEAAKIFKAKLLRRHSCLKLAGCPPEGPDEFFDGPAQGRLTTVNDDDNQEQSEAERSD